MRITSVNSSIFIHIVICIALIIAITYMLKNRVPKDTYDERQQLVRNQTFGLGFWILCFLILLNSFIKSTFEIDWATPFTETTVLICISIFIGIVKCMIKDSYFPIMYNIKRFATTELILGLLYSFIGVYRIIQGNSFDMLGRFDNYQIIFGVTLVLISLISMRYYISDKNNSLEDDE